MTLSPLSSFGMLSLASRWELSRTRKTSESYTQLSSVACCSTEKLMRCSDLDPFPPRHRRICERLWHQRSSLCTSKPITFVSYSRRWRLRSSSACYPKCTRLMLLPCLPLRRRITSEAGQCLGSPLPHLLLLHFRLLRFRNVRRGMAPLGMDHGRSFDL